MDDGRELLLVAAAAFSGGALRALPLLPSGPCKDAMAALAVAAEGWLNKVTDVERAQARASNVPVQEDHDLSDEEAFVPSAGLSKAFGPPEGLRPGSGPKAQTEESAEAFVPSCLRAFGTRGPSARHQRVFDPAAGQMPRRKL